MRALSLALGGLLLGAALPALAQTTPAEKPATPRYYVGLGAYSSYYNKFGRPYGTTGFPVPVQLTVGYQLSPRLAVQVGVAYSGHSYTYNNSNQQSSPSYVPYSIEGKNTQRLTSVTVLARYGLTQQAAHRLQFDALGGFGLEHSSYRGRGTQTDGFSGTLQTSTYDYTTVRNTLLLTAGLGASYRLSPCFELTSDFTVNRALNNIDPVYTGPALTGAAAVGLRYRFGH
ncbi:hypothetical protein GCM10022409_45830 [Hymenobacter glaciei]|uniref:Outer membrane protein beta-barrel domain-containing protein n=1 Tax=Hymenobacter glaciei TaxID=877209 RepID=A0ABP7UV61_9BACT